VTESVQYCGVCGYHNGGDGESKLLECDAVYCGASGFHKNFFLTPPEHEDQGSSILRNVENYWPSDTASHTVRRIFIFIEL
jgi:hypothetical protein